MIVWPCKRSVPNPCVTSIRPHRPPKVEYIQLHRLQHKQIKWWKETPHLRQWPPSAPQHWKKPAVWPVPALGTVLSSHCPNNGRWGFEKHYCAAPAPKAAAVAAAAWEVVLPATSTLHIEQRLKKPVRRGGRHQTLKASARRGPQRKLLLGQQALPTIETRDRPPGKALRLVVVMLLRQ